MTTAAPEKVENEVPTPVAREIEFHFWADTKFPKQFGQRVKSIGGRYSECRGDQTTRYVHVPTGDRHHADLIDEMVKANAANYSIKPKVVVVMRGDLDFEGLPSNLVVMNVPAGLESPARWIAETFDRRFKNYILTFPAFAINYKRRLEEKLNPPVPPDPNEVPKGVKDAITRCIKDGPPTWACPAFIPDYWATLNPEKPEKGHPSNYIVAGWDGERAQRLCFMVRVSRHFPRQPDEVDVVSLYRCDPVFSAPQFSSI